MCRHFGSEVSTRGEKRGGWKIVAGESWFQLVEATAVYWPQTLWASGAIDRTKYTEVSSKFSSYFAMAITSDHVQADINCATARPAV